MFFNISNQSIEGAKLVFRDKHIIGLFVISLVAFLSFGFLFTKFEMNVGAEALAAAFGTLFIILSTKFLMEKESESKIQTEKQRELFSESLKKFQASGCLMAGVLRDRKITVEELSTLLGQHSELMILGNKDTIDRSHEFIEECQKLLEAENSHFFGSSDDTEDIIMNQSADLNDANTEKLWGIAVDFMSAAREGLQLPNTYETNLSNEKKLFEFKTTKDQIIRTVREELEGGLEEWFERKKFKNEFFKGTEQTITLLKQKCQFLREKVASSQISFSDQDRKPKPVNILYINNITGAGELRFIFGISIPEHTQPDSKTLEFFESLADELDWLGAQPKAEVKEKNNKFSYNVSAYINVAEVDPTRVEKLSRALKKMVGEYNREPRKKAKA